MNDQRATFKSAKSQIFLPVYKWGNVWLSMHNDSFSFSHAETFVAFWLFIAEL